jgi:hypothetical protein
MGSSELPKTKREIKFAAKTLSESALMFAPGRFKLKAESL